MIVGIGVDVVDLARFEAALARTPRLAERLLTAREREGRARTLAGRFAAKEALAKALGSPGTLTWHDAEVLTCASGQPIIEARGTVAARAAELGADRLWVSITHDGGVAVAMVVAEASTQVFRQVSTQASTQASTKGEGR